MAAKASALRQAKLQVQLPQLHPLQQEIASSAARFKVVVCGRQFGKTALGAAMVVGGAAEGGDYGWVAPSFRVGELGWRMIVRLAQQIPGVVVQERPVYRMTFPSGGTVQMWSSEHPDSLRGMTLNGVVFDEAALARAEAWPTLRPTLSVRSGWALFISTPKGLNWFHALYENAGKWDNWARWRIPSSANPYLPNEDIELARSEMSSLLFGQEYEAEFISTSTGLFQAEWLQHWDSQWMGDERVFRLGTHSVNESDLTKFSCADLAFSMAEGADYTVISTWGVTERQHMLLLDVIRGRFEGPDVVRQIKRAYETHGGWVVVERVTRSLSIIQEAERQGLPIKEVKPDKDKIARAIPASARMEQGRMWFPPVTTNYWREIEDEMLSFPAGGHDDFVDTMAYAVLEAADVSDYADGHRLMTV